MSSDSTQPRRRSSPVRDGRGRRSDHPEGPTASRPTGYGVFLLLLLAVGVLCVAGFFVVRVLFSEPQPAPLPASFTRTDQPPMVSPGSQATGAGGTPGTAQTAINPQQGYINTLVTVMGQGWWPGEPVFIFLRSRAEGNGSGYAYAAAVADDWGKLRAAFTFPNEMRWINEEWADVIARGTRSGMEARTRFALVVPTPTNTVPVPTPRPTLPHTDTPWPTDTPAVLPSPTPEVIISDWLGEYFANPTLAGDPVYIRNDVFIDFNWGANSPEPGIPDDQFSARWTRQQFFQDRFYRFTVRSDDGVRLWIDGRLAVDEWHDGTLTPYSVDLYLAQGQHPLRLEYYENVGGAMIQLTWVQIEAPTTTPSPTTTSTPKPTDTATPTPTTTDTPLPTALPTDTPTRGPTATDTPLPTAVPTDTATPTPTPTDTASPTPVPSDTPSATPSPTRPLPGAWRAEFFTNRFLAGLPAIIRQDAEVSFDWRDGSPAPGVSPDDFSARWGGEVWLPAGEYRYSLTVDEGARLWIDGQLIIDEWHLATGETYLAALSLPEGIHVFLVEYFEATGSAYIHLSGEPTANRMQSP